MEFSRNGSPAWLIVADHKPIVASDMGELLVAEASAGGFVPISRVQILPATCWTPPTLANGRIYCRNNKGELVCLDVATDVVRKTIQSYRAGVTTFADFKKDAALEELKPDSSNPPARSYLDPGMDATDSKMSGGMTVYITSEKSPWKILEQGAESSSESRTTSGSLFGKPGSSSSSTKKLKFVVGDSKGAVCILDDFDGDGKLNEIKPLP